MLLQLDLGNPWLVPCLLVWQETPGTSYCLPLTGKPPLLQRAPGCFSWEMILVNHKGRLPATGSAIWSLAHSQNSSIKKIIIIKCFMSSYHEPSNSGRRDFRHLIVLMSALPSSCQYNELFTPQHMWESRNNPLNTAASMTTGEQSPVFSEASWHASWGRRRLRWVSRSRATEFCSSRSCQTPQNRDIYLDIYLFLLYSYV